MTLGAPEAVQILYRGPEEAAVSEDASCVLAGPGLGYNPQLLMRIFQSTPTEIPLILDADALNFLAQDQEARTIIEKRAGNTVLTPHMGEASRLYGQKIADLYKDLPGTARKLAAQYQSVVVLKNASTVKMCIRDRCVGEARTEKYSEQFGTRGNILFVLMQLLPFFPDDILCMVAGLSSMSLRFFTVTMVLTRPVFLAAVCFLGSGTIIPFSGWRIPVWVAIFVAAGILFLLFCRYQEKIESWLKDKICGWRTKNKNQT